MQSKGTYQLSLMLTERCNLRCSYCYCDKRRHGVMPIEVARHAIDEVAEAGYENLRLLLMGGEPFLEFDLLRRIVDYANSRMKSVCVKAVSNGTLIHGNVQRWLQANKESIFVSLSLDGDRESHNRNRCGSYDDIDFSFFTSTYGNAAEASMVACVDNIGQLARNVQHVEGLGFNVKCVLADDEGWQSERDSTRLAEQLELLLHHYFNNPGIMPFSMLREALQHIVLPNEASQCRPFENTHCIGPDGRRYACHRCTPYYNNGAWQIAEGEEQLKADGITPQCSACPARRVCLSCPALVQSLQHNTALATHLCKLFKVVHIANASFIAQLFLYHPSHPYLQRLPYKSETIAGAQHILNNLQI